MKIVELIGVSKGYFSQKLYKDVNIEINDCEKVVLVGHNGTGKSTLLKIITGEERADRGEVIINEDKKIVSFNQFNDLDLKENVMELLNLPFKHIMELQKKVEDISNRFSDENEDMDSLMEEYSKALDEFESYGGYGYIHTQSQFIETFDLTDKLERKYGELSGGEKQYIRLALALFEKGDLVILDEPLSFFDRKKEKWLMEYINESSKSFLVISHNVDFLRGIATKVLDIDNNRVDMYECNYRDYLKKKKELIKEDKKHNKKIDLEIEELVEHIRRKEKLLERCNNKHAHAVILRRMRKDLYKLHKSKVHFSDEYKYEYLEAPDEAYNFIKRESDDELLKLRGVEKYFGDRLLFKDVNLDVKKDTKIVIVGENGVGKTTLLKIMGGLEKQTFGDVILGKNVKVAYIEQEIVFPNEDLRVKEYLKEKTGLSEEFLDEAIDTLYNYEDEFRDKKLYMLSGGERKRLEIFANTLAEVDILIIDEPTTYMDDYSKEVIVNMLEDYDGAIILVSHDRVLMRGLEFEKYDIRDNRFRVKESGENRKDGKQ